MAKHVIYVAGKLLVIPMMVILAIHVIEEKKVIKFPKNKQVANLPDQKQQFRTQQGVKRHVEAQKDVRDRRKQRTKK